MEVREFGPREGKKLLLIPGNMMCWRQFQALIPCLEGEFHLIVVSTDGYDGTGETVFTTAEASAGKLEAYIRERLDGRIDLVLGESFGGATAGLLFERGRVAVGGMIMSGPQYMSLGPLNVLMQAIIPRNQFRLVTRVQSMRRLPWMLKLYTRGDEDAMLRQFDNIPPHIALETLQNCTREALTLYGRIDGFTPRPDAHVAVWYGEKEPNMKKAVQKLRRAYPKLEERAFVGYGHGEIIAHPEQMAGEIRRFLRQ